MESCTLFVFFLHLFANFVIFTAINETSCLDKDVKQDTFAALLTEQV